MNAVEQLPRAAFQRLLDSNHFFEPVSISDDELSRLIVDNSKEPQDAYEKVTVGIIYPKSMTWTVRQNCLDYLLILAGLNDVEYRAEQESEIYPIMMQQMEDLLKDQSPTFADMVDALGFMTYNTATERRIQLPTRNLIWEVN